MVWSKPDLYFFTEALERVGTTRNNVEIIFSRKQINELEQFSHNKQPILYLLGAAQT
jgi:hypothetical protein